MRSKSVEIEVNKDLIPRIVLSQIDLEYSSRFGCYMAYFHVDGCFEFKKEFLQYLGAVISVYNNVTDSDNLNLYTESEIIDEFGVDNGPKKYKNIRFSEIGEINVENVLTAKEVYNIE